MKKITLTIENQLYGPAQYPAYADRGLCCYKRGRAWRVAHVASGLEIDVCTVLTTKAEASALMSALLALPLDWDRPWDELKADFGALASVIRTVTTQYRHPYRV